MSILQVSILKIEQQYGIEVENPNWISMRLTSLSETRPGVFLIPLKSAA